MLQVIYFLILVGYVYIFYRVYLNISKLEKELKESKLELAKIKITTDENLNVLFEKEALNRNQLNKLENMLANTVSATRFLGKKK